LSHRIEDPLLGRFISQIAYVSLIIAGILIFLHTVGQSGIAAGIAGTAGIGAFVIGFAFKDIGEHFLAGFILAFNRPFRVGDLVKLNGEKGIVKGLNIRNTHLKTFDGQDVFIPNGAIIKNTLANYTIDGFLRQEIKFGLDYDINLDEVVKIILNELKDIPGVLQEDKEPMVAVAELGTSTLNIIVYYWLDTFDKSVSGVKVKLDVTNRLLRTLNGLGYYMPADIIEVKNYKDSNLKMVK
jgi:small-conductance mechanosensitive channel